MKTLFTVLESKTTASTRQACGREAGAGAAAAGRWVRHSTAHLVETAGTLAAIGAFFVALAALAGEWLGGAQFAGLADSFTTTAEVAKAPRVAASNLAMARGA